MSKANKYLVVELDKTLIKSDMLYETFWSAFSKNFLIPIKSIFYLIFGKANLKFYLGNLSKVDIKTLPYNNIVIDYINSHKSKGGKVALITSSNQKVAFQIANYLNIFDEVHGSSNNKNLKGKEKVEFLNKRFGIKNYDYLGNYFIDIEICKYANKIITIDASNYLKSKFNETNINCSYLISEKKVNSIYSFLKAIRPYQWLKNSLIFLPIIAAHKINNLLIADSLFAFFAFSFIASSVYLINDLLDLKADRKHLKKNKRPFASGELPMEIGHLGGVSIFVIGIIFGLKIGITFLLILLIYFSITIAYSIYFKKKTIIDIFILSLLYTIRIIGGGVATNTNISFWLLAFSVFIFLSLAAIKRQSELVDLISQGKSKMTGRGYFINDLTFISSLALGTGLLANLVIILYINTPKVISLYSHPEFLWGACFLLLFWIIHMCFKTNRGEMHYDPIIFAIKDKLSISIIFAIFSFVIMASKI